MAEYCTYEKYVFKKKLETLRNKSGRSMELISLYIPSDKQISDVTNHLREEHEQASNIESKLTRNNVQGALDSLLAKLRYLNRIPENGIVYFAGIVDTGANRTSMENEVLIPPEPVVHYIYHSDSIFYLEPLEEMLRECSTYGLILLDQREATIGMLVGKQTEVIKHLHSTVPGKQRKGGQSAHRFEQLRRIAIHDFYKRIGDAASEAFLEVEPAELKGILIGGHSPAKEEFNEGGFLHYELQKKVLGLFDTGYTDESGFSELINAAEHTLQGIDLIKQKKDMEMFFKEMGTESGKVSYGEDNVRENLEIKAVDVLLLSEDLRSERVTLKCSVCGYENKWTRKWKPNETVPVAGNCPECGYALEFTDVIDIVGEFSELADKGSARIAFISTDFDEGSQLMIAFGGIAAILRYNTGV
ncbi:Eukaryotic peptide chain release factor subunit 1 [Methanosarcina horonobensis HB-1 = JCM 15518]|uniref:Peptide chain release factor subunit 1 n=1 Tax=Methanosarcina horonobensis HB-1 = JCM 15518 TaxID=1434110 RepID=A0A0E3SAY6_9EURY|nr:peptide chain release factor aRF-1 [Methanosarcina horonobensis]AKB78939.1 Eukaryotic peptide chain release factor subunit 1 [Methanosarcina horonobensis HB-1 = JCM 15518]